MKIVHKMQFIIISVVFLLIFQVTVAQNKNVCNTYLSYLYKPVSNQCFNNPDVDLDMPTLVTRYGLQLETYTVLTKDGYYLTVYRLPNPDPKGVVYLQHPATGSCAVWVDKGPQSLGHILHAAGYDVWLGNFRGSYYSRKHITLDPNQKAYWNFSYHEMGVYDIPSVIELIKNTTKVEKITFLGQSMSGEAAAIYASLFPEKAAADINGFVFLAPSIYLKYIKTPLRLLAYFHNIIYNFLDLLGFVELLPRNNITRNLGKLCYATPLFPFCIFALEAAMGYSWEQMTPQLFPILFSQNPAGLSLKTLNHFAQSVVNDGKFSYYDYGDKNMDVYKTKEPPLYPIQNITVPTYVIYGSKDLMVTKEDTLNFYNDLKLEIRHGLYEVEGFNHFNFFYAKDVVKSVYSKVVDVIDNFNNMTPV